MVPAILISIFLGGFFIYNQYTNLERSLVERGESLVKQISPASEFGVFSGNAQILSNITLSAMEQPDVSAISIYDKFGAAINKAGEQTVLLTPYGTNGNVEAILNQEAPENIQVFSAPIYKTELSFFICTDTANIRGLGHTLYIELCGSAQEVFWQDEDNLSICLL